MTDVRQILAYTSYAAGSVIFLYLALSRGSVLLAVGSGLFLLGTLLFVVPKVTSNLPRSHASSRVPWRAPPRGGAAR